MLDESLGHQQRPAHAQDEHGELFAQVEPRRDISVIENMRAPNDPRALGSARVIIDATRPTHVAFPTRLKVPQEAMERVKLDEWLDASPGSAP